MPPILIIIAQVGQFTVTHSAHHPCVKPTEAVAQTFSMRSVITNLCLARLRAESCKSEARQAAISTAPCVTQLCNNASKLQGPGMQTLEQTAQIEKKNPERLLLKNIEQMRAAKT